MKTYFQQLCFTLLLINTLSYCTKPTNACFTFSPDSAQTNSDVSFNASCTENGGYSYQWNFGDNSPDTTVLGSPFISHKYQTSGTFTVTLTAARKDGVVLKEGNATTVQTINIQ